MTTKLDRPLKREIRVGDTSYTVKLDAQGLSIAEKGHRKGVQLAWRDLISGDARPAAALNASSSQ